MSFRKMLLFVEPQARLLLERLVTVLKIANVWSVESVRIDMLDQVLLLGEFSAASFAEESAKKHVVRQQMSFEAVEHFELLFAANKGAVKGI